MLFNYSPVAKTKQCYHFNKMFTSKLFYYFSRSPIRCKNLNCFSSFLFLFLLYFISFYVYIGFVCVNSIILDEKIFIFIRKPDKE